MNKLLAALPKHAVLLFSAFLALVPTMFMISTALKTDEEYAVDKLGFPSCRCSTISAPCWSTARSCGGC